MSTVKKKSLWWAECLGIYESGCKLVAYVIGATHKAAGRHINYNVVFAVNVQ